MEDFRAELNNAVEEFNRLQIAKSLNFNKLYLYSIITHSTAIEGSTISETENLLMFDEGLVPAGHNVMEQLMNIDLKKAYDHAATLAQQKPNFTVSLLKQLSALVMKNTGSVYSTVMGDFDSSRGDLRLINVSAGRGGKSYLSFQKVPQKLEEFCLWLNEERNKNFLNAAKAYEFSFEAHFRLVTIHPWADGNGRVSRLLTNMLQMEQNLLPSIIKNEQKAEYIDALANAQDKKDSRIFTEFMMISTTKFITECIKEYNLSGE
ncbi:MAG: Fic family protein [Selenomonadaceae bacterium]|nr:Fic family protein [Selenomonadaceae bacterium]